VEKEMMWTGIIAVSSLLLLARFFYTRYRINSTQQPPTTSSLATFYQSEKILSTDLEADIREKWSKPLSTLPVHIDIPRLAKKIKVLRFHDPKSSSTLFSASEDTENSPQLILGIFLAVSQQFETPPFDHSTGHPSPSLPSLMESKFPDYFTNPLETSICLFDFMHQVVGAESKTVKVLKACTQSLLAPAVLKLKFSVGSKFPFRDKRGSWNIRVEFVEAEQLIKVIHCKEETSFDDSVEGFFGFRWSLCITFDRDVTEVVGASLFIEGVRISPEMPPDKVSTLESLMHPYLLNPGVPITELPITNTHSNSAKKRNSVK